MIGLALIKLAIVGASAAYFKCAAVSSLNVRPLANTSTSNRFVEIVVADNGKFSIGTKECDPRRASDNDKKLLFGHPSPSTSDTMIRVDGISYSLHSASTSSFSAGSDDVTITLTTASVQVTQRLRLVK